MADEAIIHFGMLRVRVNGEGELKLRLRGYDDDPDDELMPITMKLSPGREMDRLCNFSIQRVRVRTYITGINEHFHINRIIIFAKTIYTSFPGNQ